MRAQDLSICRKAVRTKDGRLPPEPVLGDSVMSGRLLISGRHLWSLMSGRLRISGRHLILTGRRKEEKGRGRSPLQYALEHDEMGAPRRDAEKEEKKGTGGRCGNSSCIPLSTVDNED